VLSSTKPATSAELHRKRREFIASLAKIRICAQKLADSDFFSGLPIEAEARLHEDMEYDLLQVDEAIKAMVRDLSDVAFTFATGKIKELMVRYIFISRAIQISTRPPAVKLAMLDELTAPLHIFLTAGWRLPSRLRALRYLPKVLDKATAKPQPSTTETSATQ
jgi:hypothetical protein